MTGSSASRKSSIKAPTNAHRELEALLRPQPNDAYALECFESIDEARVWIEQALKSGTELVIQLARGFDPGIDGHKIFPLYRTHLEQSQMLKHDLITLTLTVHKFGLEQSDERADALKRLISRFCDRSLRFLMYRDWSSFESFFDRALEMRQRSRHAPTRPSIRDLLEDFGPRSQQTIRFERAGGGDLRGKALAKKAFSYY